MFFFQIPLSWALSLLLLILVPLDTGASEAPHTIGGISLGTSIDDYPNIIRTNFLKEVVVTDQHGFRKGVISYGACLHKKTILKIDMKYRDKSKKFYKKLLAKFQGKFGEADSWNGDSFGVVHIWKWRFTDKEGNRVTLALQYNGKDSGETIGNMVKLSYPEKIEEERLCFVQMCQQAKKPTTPRPKSTPEDVDWSYLIPH